MPITQEDVTGARTTAQGYLTTANQMAAQEPTVADVIKAKTIEAYDSNKDILEPLGTATSSYLSAPATARSKYENIWNPFEREKLVSQYTANEAIPMMTLSNILGMRQGGIGNIIGAGTRGYQAQTAAAQAKATQAEKLYSDLFGEYKTQQDEDYRQKQLALDYYKANKTGSGSALGTDLKWLLQYGKPTAGQEEKAINAESALGSIEMVKSALAKNNKALKYIGTPDWLLGGVGANNVLAVKKNLNNIADILTRTRTGAALNEQEQKFYGEFIVNPVQALTSGGKSTEESFKILEGIFKKVKKAGENPYQGLLDTILSGGEDPDFIPN